MMIDRRRALLLAPFGVAAVVGAGFYGVLQRMKVGKFDPHEVPSQLIGKPVPEFTLPGVGSAAGFASGDVARGGRPVLVNFFASWCQPCVYEAPILLNLAQGGMPIWGIVYKDQPGAVQGYFARHGNPYARLANDAPGRVAIDFGVYGVPESYLVDQHGVVRWRMAGPITPDAVEGQLLPLLKSLA